MTDPLGLGSSAWPSMAWQVAWQSTAVLSIGLVASRIVAMRPARSHRILLAAVLACLVVPPASLVARRLDFGLLTPRPAGPDVGPGRVGAAASGTAPAPSVRPISHQPGPATATTPLGSSSIPAGGVSARWSSKLAETAAAVRGDGDGATPRPDLGPSFLIPIAWGLLAAAGLLRLAASFAGGLRLKAGALILRDPGLVATAEAAARSLGLSAAPEVRTSASVRCPVVWCWGKRPVLILPEALACAVAGPQGDWSPVLCHELAHWKRADHLSGLAAELLTCLLPWQPLAWVLRGGMAGLSELACDDWALTHARAVTPHDYAEALLGLVADRRRPLVPAAVSRRSGLGVRVRHILEETEPRPRTGILWSTLVTCLALGLVVGLALTRTRQARAIAAERPAAEAAGEGAGAANRTTIEGTVRGPKGEPLPGVDVYWVGMRMPPLSHVAMPHDHPDFGKRPMQTLARGKTDDRGHFSLAAAVERPTSNGPWTMVVAHTKGMAPGSSMVALDGKPLEVRVDPAVPIVGRLLGPGGEPAAGVGVRLEGYNNGEWRDPRTARMMQFGKDEAWDSRPAFHPAEVRTDDAGRFVLDGFVPEGMFAKLLLTHPAYAVEELTVSTGKSGEPTPALEAFSVRPLPREFTHTLGPARPVIGRVTDAETRAPLPGITVEVTPMRRHGGQLIRTVTDGEGRYRVSDRDGESYWVAAYPPAGSGYLPARGNRDQWPAGESELRMDLSLRRGVVVRGVVVDEETGAPIAGAGVVYQPTNRNPQARGNGDFRSPALTDDRGRFALTGVRGPGVVAAEAPSLDYIRRTVAPVDFGHTSSMHVHGLARFELPAEGDSPEVVIKMKRGFTFEARALGPDGSAVDMVRAWCPELMARLIENWVSPTECADGVFRLPGAEPGRTYRVFFLDLDRKLGAVAELKAEPGRKAPVEVRLRPTATIRGRVLDGDGMPIEGAQILPRIQLVDKGSTLSERDSFDSFVTQVYTQFTNDPLKQVYPAEFRYDRLIPGVRYFVTWYTREDGHSSRAVEPLGPGEDRDLGDIRSEKKGGKDGN